MNGKDLLEGLGYVDEALVAEAEAAPKSRRLWRRWLPVAACLCVVIAAGVLYSPAAPENLPNQSEDKQTQSQASLMPENGSNVEMMPGYEKDAQDQIGQELPSMVIRVEAWEGEGFRFTVAATVDTQRFPVGTELTAVFAERMVIEELSGEIIECRWATPTPEEFPEETRALVQFSLEDDGTVRLHTIRKENVQ